jgi:POT family proton-dependent oligopeptide transporter
MFALLNLYAHTEVDRRMGGFEIPTTWLQTISLCSFFVCIPLLARFWRRLAGSGRNPSASWKLALGIGALAVGYAILAVGESERAAGLADIGWLVATYLLFGLGDALVWPGQISLTSKLAPARYTAFAVGAWYVCIGIGTWLAGYVGAVAAPFPFESVFVALGIALAAIAGMLALLTPRLKRLMHGCETPSGPADEGASRAARSGMAPPGGAGQDPAGRSRPRTDSSAA